MARPKQDGLHYFSLDTDFFFADRRIKALRSRYGSDGLIFYIYLLTEIYRNGYYIGWDEDSVDNAIADLGLTEGLIEQIMSYLVSRSLLTKIELSTLANPVTVITSPGIQKRYQEAVKGLKRDVFVRKEIWRLDSQKTASYIKFAPETCLSEKNHSKSEKNHSKSEKNPINEMKQNEISNKNIMCKADALALFEKLWKLYPCKRGKGKVSLTQKMKLLQIGQEEMERAISRYKAELEKDKDWRKMQNGSTFFNSGYVDYLDANYEPGKQASYRKQNGFNRFQQNQYDFDQLEQELMSNDTGNDRKRNPAQI